MYTPTWYAKTASKAKGCNGSMACKQLLFYMHVWYQDCLHKGLSQSDKSTNKWIGIPAL